MNIAGECFPTLTPCSNAKLNPQSWGVLDYGEHAVKCGLATHNARYTPNGRHRGVVGVKRQAHPLLLTEGNDGSQEVFHIGPQCLLSEYLPISGVALFRFVSIQ